MRTDFEVFCPLGLVKVSQSWDDKHTPGEARAEYAEVIGFWLFDPFNWAQ
jgi:hypothetical protein